MRRPSFILLFLFLLLELSAFAQSDSLLFKLEEFPTSALSKLQNRLEDLDKKVSKTSRKILLDVEKQERKLYRKLFRKDSAAANALFQSSVDGLNHFVKKIESDEVLSKSKQYIPYIDTLQTVVKFLSANAGSINISGIPIKNVSRAIDNLQKQITSASSLRRSLNERQDLLKTELEKFGLVKELKGYNKRIYYYSQQLSEYKKILQQPEKLERQALALLQNIPAFKKFWQEHSELAALFPMPDNYGTMAALQGLQTRAVVQASIQQQIQAGGPNAEMMIQQHIQAAHQQIRQWKEKLNKIGGLNSVAEIPDFKPNAQRTKKFFSRLEYGLNFQNTRANSFWPISTDFGFSLGFKINDAASIGVGGAYKMGWGRDIRQITITHEGIGLRSYFEYKIRGNIYASGGYEQNYRQRFDNMRMLRYPNHWQQSGLVGISKRYSINKKLRGDFKILFDYLYRSHSPASQPILLRFGYGL